MSAPHAVIYGVSGLTLTASERAFLREADPLGFILFARNCEKVSQVRALTDDLREVSGREHAPVLIDQEGGTVMRLRPPVWHAAPDAARLGTLFLRDPTRARAATRTLGQLFGAELRDIGVDVDCAPVADLGLPQTTGAIGTRAYSHRPDVVSELARAMAEGLMEEGCLPIVKHVPGHGRAEVDSHRTLPRVATDLETLREADFEPFRSLNDLPLAMSAHVVYEAVDDALPATISKKVIDTIVRGEIGFDGFLFSDDLAMSALSGTPAERAERVIAAGCDAVLHCTGSLAEMEQVAQVVPRLSPASEERWTRAHNSRKTAAGGTANTYAAKLRSLLGNWNPVET